MFLQRHLPPEIGHPGQVGESPIEMHIEMTDPLLQFDQIIQRRVDFHAVLLARGIRGTLPLNPARHPSRHRRPIPAIARPTTEVCNQLLHRAHDPVRFGGVQFLPGAIPPADGHAGHAVLPGPDDVVDSIAHHHDRPGRQAVGFGDFSRTHQNCFAKVFNKIASRKISFIEFYIVFSTGPHRPGQAPESGIYSAGT